MPLPANTPPRWWEGFSCDGMFLILDTSAHLNDGIPSNDSIAEAHEHLASCDTCQWDVSVVVVNSPLNNENEEDD